MSWSQNPNRQFGKPFSYLENINSAQHKDPAHTHTQTQSRLCVCSFLICSLSCWQSRTTKHWTAPTADQWTEKWEAEKGAWLVERAFCPEQLQNKCEFYEIMAQKYFIMQNAWPKKGSVCVCVGGGGCGMHRCCAKLCNSNGKWTWKCCKWRAREAGGF